MKNYLKSLQERCKSGGIEYVDKLEIKNLFNRMKEYWYLYDIDNGTNHCQIFEALFLSKTVLSYNEIAGKFYIGERTLDRYISKYNRFAMNLIEQEKLFKNDVFKNVK